MQDYRVRRPKSRRFSLRRKSKNPKPASALGRSPGLTPLPRQPRPPRHRLGHALRGAFAWVRPMLRPGRSAAAAWFLAGMLWLGGGMIWSVLNAWNAPLQALEITGGEKLTPVQIAAAAGLYPGIPVGGLDPLTLAERLLAHPRIAQADVRRTLPGRLDIRVAERQPAALALLNDGRTALLDREGVVLENGTLAEAPIPPLPRLSGGGAEAHIGRTVGDGPLRRALEFAEQVKALPELGNEAITVDARDAFAIRVSLDARGRTLILPSRSSVGAMRTYLRVEPALLAAAPGFRTADVRALPREGAEWIALSR